MRPFPTASRADIALLEPCGNRVPARGTRSHDLFNNGATLAANWRALAFTADRRDAEQRIASRLGDHSAQIELIAIKAKHKVPNGK
jgi:hypothetical protein